MEKEGVGGRRREEEGGRRRKEKGGRRKEGGERRETNTFQVGGEFLASTFVVSHNTEEIHYNCDGEDWHNEEKKGGGRREGEGGRRKEEEGGGRRRKEGD
jgi:hypothetical protein